MIRQASPWPLQIHPLHATFLLVAPAVGTILIAGFTLLALVPLVMILGGIALTVVVTLLLLGWAGIEAMAAIERWMEQDPRFQR